jgi:polyene glycosyltransferase
VNSTQWGPIIFAGIASSGMFNPLLAVAAELSRQGVGGLWFACTDNGRRDIEQAAIKTPINFISLGPESEWIAPGRWDPKIFAKVTTRSRTKNIFELVRYVARGDTYVSMYERLAAETVVIKPALLVIYAGFVPALDVAGKQGIPYVSCTAELPSAHLIDKLPVSFPAPFSGFSKRMNLGQRIKNLVYRSSYKLVSTLGFLSSGQTVSYIRGRRSAGLSAFPKSVITQFDTALDVICFSIFGIEYEFPKVIENLWMVGAAIPSVLKPAGGGALYDWLESRKSVIYINFGTIGRLSTEQMSLVLHTVRLLPSHDFLWRMTKEAQCRLPWEPHLPVNLRIENWLPSQIDVLAHPHVRVFFNHAGSNSVHEALYFGKPVLMMPLWLDCYDLAARVTDAGSGLTVGRREKNKPEVLASKLTRLVSDPSFRRKALELGRIQQSAGGVETAAGIILKRVKELQ